MHIPDFTANIRFLTTSEGGRRRPILNGYRPTIKLLDKLVWLGSFQSSVFMSCDGQIELGTDV
jgi:hypothetical protein